MPRPRHHVGSAALVLALCGCDPEPEPLPDGSAVPRIDACDPARAWSRTWAEAEDEVLDRIDRARAQGIRCGTAGQRPVAPSLRVNGSLVCAARNHAFAMATRGFVGHLDPEGVGPDERAAAAEYDGTVVEHWAAGPDDARALVDDLWLLTASHCADLTARDFVEVGIGHVGDVDDDNGTYWVVVLGAP